jgi:hypothetical protein
MQIKKINFLLYFILALYIPLFNYFYELNLNGGHTFLTADWLINYQFGYIKRGLPGTFILFFLDDAKSILNFISFFVISIYVLNIYLTVKLFKSYKQSLYSYLLLFSPATLLFPLFDSQGAFRKEILGFNVLLILLNFHKSKYKLYFLILSGGIFGFAVFSHEVNLFFSIAIFFILKNYYPDFGMIKYSILLVPVILNLSSFFLFSNDELTMRLIKDAICNDLYLRGLESLCNTGIMDYIYWDFNANLNQTLFHVLNKQYTYQNYIYLFIICILPYLLTEFFKKNIIFTLFLGLSFLPLFFLAIDWGRWIHMFIFSLSLIVFSQNDKNEFNKLFIPLLVPYSFLIKIEHCCKPKFNLQNISENFDIFYNSIRNFYF